MIKKLPKKGFWVSICLYRFYIFQLQLVTSNTTKGQAKLDYFIYLLYPFKLN